METTTKNKGSKKLMKPTSDRKRPNKALILHNAEVTGTLSANDRLMLTGLKVKNVLQRVNNRAFDKSIKTVDCIIMEKAMRAFVKEIDSVLK